MNFKDFESRMNALGINSLAEIARALDSTPQAVSNWKARGHVPYHIIAKISNLSIEKNPFSKEEAFKIPSLVLKKDKNSMGLSDLLLTLAEQLKVIVLISFICVFISVTYIQFIQKPQYISSATILIPENKINNIGAGFAGIASQFGVSLPSTERADLSSPHIIPDLLQSRTFGIKLLEKKFYTEQFKKDLTLEEILNGGKQKFTKERLVSTALSRLREMVSFSQNPQSSFNTIYVKTNEPKFSKDLASAILIELELLNRFFKSQTVSEKLSFIENRIESVSDDLENSEKLLKKFNERNRQVNSPSLRLEQNRLNQDLEIHKSIFLTLKQQYELAKIEEVQESSILQILDYPQLPLFESNRNLKIGIILSIFFGICLGIVVGFIRSYIYNKDIDERRKIRKVRSYLRKKSRELIFDKRFSGSILFALLCGIPFYFGYESKNPIFFGRFSAKIMVINTLYILALLFFLFTFFKSRSLKNKSQL